jgi:hypothetical protein
VTNTWEGEREVLDVKTNALLAAGVVSAFDSGVNSIGQRSSVATRGSAFMAAAGWAWGSQVHNEVSIKLLQDVHARTHPASQAATSPVEIPSTD